MGSTLGAGEEADLWFLFLLHQLGNDGLGPALLTAFQLVDRSLQLQQVFLALLRLGSLGDHCCFIIRRQLYQDTHFFK